MNGFKCGDFVRQCFSGFFYGPVMKIVGFVASTCEAICELVTGGICKTIRVSVFCLILAGTVVESAHETPANDLPTHTIGQQPQLVITNAASGTTTTPAPRAL